jgi:hypothetical protein
MKANSLYRNPFGIAAEASRLQPMKEIELPTCRALIGAAADNLSDDDVLALREYMRNLANIIVDAYADQDFDPNEADTWQIWTDPSGNQW